MILRLQKEYPITCERLQIYLSKVIKKNFPGQIIWYIATIEITELESL